MALDPFCSTELSMPLTRTRRCSGRGEGHSILYRSRGYLHDWADGDELFANLREQLVHRSGTSI